MRRGQLPHVSLSTWARVALALGFLVIFGSMVLSIMETGTLNVAYQRAAALSQVNDDKDAFTVAVFKQQVAINAYAQDALTSAGLLFGTGQSEADAAAAQLRTDAARQNLLDEAEQMINAGQVWQGWAVNLKAEVDNTRKPVTNQTILNGGQDLYASYLGAQGAFQNLIQQRSNAQLAIAGKLTDDLGRVTVIRSVVAAVLLTLLGFLLTRRVLVPVAKLAGAARALAAGRSATIPETQRSDEVGDLSRALAAWQQSRTDRERLFDVSADLFCIAGGGYFKQINRAWEKLTGYSSEELMGRPYLDYYHPEDRQRVTAEVARVRAGTTSFGFRARFACKDGSYRWLEWTVAPVASEGLSYGVARDVTEQVSAEEMLRVSGEQIRSILDNVADGIVTMDRDGTLQSVNPLVLSMFGYSAKDLVSRPVSMLIAEPERGDFLTHLQSYLRPDKKRVRSGSHETVGRRKDGTTFPLEFIGSQMQTGNERIFIGTLRDITEQKAERDALQRRLLYDSLTNLPNRTLFMDRLHETITRSPSSEKRWGLMILDIDRFKEVNDSLGHDEGDKLLVAVARRLSGAISQASRIARMGGDEFAIWSSRIGDPESAATRAAQILASLEEPFTIGGRKIDVRASIGIALYPDHGSDVDALMRHADVAMYLAKRKQAGFAIYSAAADESQSGARLALRGEIRHALYNQEFFLEYMPIVSLRHSELESLEALLRWQHPERGTIAPNDFIPAVEQTELIHGLTRWVLETAVGQLHRWRERSIATTVSVNLSALNLEDASMVGWLGDLLKRFQIQPPSLVLEITETSAMAPGTAAVMKELDELGVRLSIDDFGTGYSSLAYLQRLPVDLIKIDRSFVGEMLTNAGAASIVRSVIDLAHNLGLQSVAEGVERREVEQMLTELGCDYAQGYYISRPLAAEAASGWIAGRGQKAA